MSSQKTMFPKRSKRKRYVAKTECLHVDWRGGRDLGSRGEIQSSLGAPLYPLAMNGLVWNVKSEGPSTQVQLDMHMPHDMPCEKKMLAVHSQKDCWRRSFCTPFFIASNNTEGKEVSALNAFWEDKINDAPREKGE